jgi:hypothetical protein
VSQAEISNITTRRRLLRGAAAAPVIASRMLNPLPDVELIGVCTGMHNLKGKMDDLFNHGYDDDRITELSEPLNEAWFPLRDRLLTLNPPSTSEGARAAALALLANLPAESFEMAAQDADPVVWLAIGVARFVVGAA